MNVEGRRYMKNADKIVVLALISICAAIAFLTIRNDRHYNNERQSEASRIASQDSSARKQMDSLSMMLNDATTQLDSIRCLQKDNIKIVNRDLDSINKSLEKIARIGQRKINSKK